MEQLLPNRDKAFVPHEKLTDYSVVLTRDLPEYGLTSGDVGAVVHCYANGPAYEVEFVSGSGHTVALVTVNENDIRQIQGSEILHVRALAA